MNDLADLSGTREAMADALGILADPERSLEDRAAVYAVAQRMRLTLDRALKANRDDIIVGMERAGLQSMGPLSVKSTAVDPSYPCNDRDNWTDATVQDTLRDMLDDPILAGYVRTIPTHFEIAVDVLAADVQMGVQGAIDLYRELNRRGWRREEARRLSLAVREPKRAA